MKNETLVFLAIGVLAVWLYLNRKNNNPSLLQALNPDGSDSHTSTPSAGAGGSDLSNGYGLDTHTDPAPATGFTVETHGDPFPIRHGIPKPKPGLPVYPSKQPYMKGNFQNSPAGYSRKIGYPTNNVRLLPGKVNSGNRQGLGLGRAA